MIARMPASSPFRAWIESMSKEPTSAIRLAPIIKTSEATTSRRLNGEIWPRADEIVLAARHWKQSPVFGLIRFGYLSADDVLISEASVEQIPDSQMLEQLLLRARDRESAAVREPAGEDDSGDHFDEHFGGAPSP